MVNFASSSAGIFTEFSLSSSSFHRVLGEVQAVFVKFGIGSKFNQLFARSSLSSEIFCFSSSAKKTSLASSCSQP